MGCPEPLIWSIALEGKSDLQRFQLLNWGLRTWDYWNFNTCDQRFGNDWEGRIPAQLVAHALFYFTDPQDSVLDPMAGGGVVSDVCLLFERKCLSFDAAVSDKRPEILYHYWDPSAIKWPRIKKPDFIFFDPPYFSKMDDAYKKKTDSTTSISSLSKEDYETFLTSFFTLAHENTKSKTRLAFLNADWRDFQSTPAIKEQPANAITIFDYHRLLSQTGWEISHRIECPLSSERFIAFQVRRMQAKKILGTVSRSLLIAKRDD